MFIFGLDSLAIEDFILGKLNLSFWISEINPDNDNLLYRVTEIISDNCHSCWIKTSQWHCFYSEDSKMAARQSFVFTSKVKPSGLGQRRSSLNEIDKWTDLSY